MINNLENNFFKDISISNDAYKLANAIYNTYKIDEDAYLSISAKNLINLFPHLSVYESIFKIRALFMEINEPILIQHFEYRNRYISWKTISFCYCDNCIEDINDVLELELDEMYLELLENDKSQKILKI